MVKVNKYPEQRIQVFTPEHKSLGFVNYNELLDIQVQISEHKYIGYYVLYNGKKITIDELGQLEDWVDGMFDTQQKLFAKLWVNRTK